MRKPRVSKREKQGILLEERVEYYGSTKLDSQSRDPRVGLEALKRTRPKHTKFRLLEDRMVIKGTGFRAPRLLSLPYSNVLMTESLNEERVLVIHGRRAEGSPVTLEYLRFLNPQGFDGCQKILNDRCMASRPASPARSRMSARQHFSAPAELTSFPVRPGEDVASAAGHDVHQMMQGRQLHDAGDFEIEGTAMRFRSNNVDWQTPLRDVDKIVEFNDPRHILLAVSEQTGDFGKLLRFESPQKAEQVRSLVRERGVRVEKRGATQSQTQRRRLPMSRLPLDNSPLQRDHDFNRSGRLRDDSSYRY